MQKKSKVGRKPKAITPEVMFEKAREGATKAEIATDAGIHPGSLSRLQEQNSELSEAYDMGKAEFLKQFEKRIIPKITSAFEKRIEAGGDAAIIFGMKAIVGYTEASRLEHTGANGGPIELTNVTTRELEEKFEKLKRIELERSTKTNT